MSSRESSLTALLIAPDRELADRFQQTLAAAHTFQIVSDLRNYPTEQALDLRLRQIQPDVVLLDLVSELETALSILQYLANRNPAPFTIGLHTEQDGDAIVRALRAGATEFLAAPFDLNSQQEAIGRILRLREPEPWGDRSAATVIGFCSTKPGSGASTLAAQVAFALRRLTAKRVLLADFDLMGGTVGFYLKLQHPYSLVDALQSETRLDAPAWRTLVTSVEGVDVLVSPEEPSVTAIDVPRLQEVIELMRSEYDYVVLDLPTVFERSSLLALTHADTGYLVSTSELPSLHLTRKALQMLHSIGFDSERIRVIVNRLNRKDGLDGNDLGKMFNSPVHATLPNDYFSLHRVVTRGEPLSGSGELVRAIEALAGKIAGVKPAEPKKSLGLLGVRPILSGI